MRSECLLRERFTTILRGAFRFIVDLQMAIHRYIAGHNDDPKPFARTMPTDTTLAKTQRGAVPSE